MGINSAASSTGEVVHVVSVVVPQSPATDHRLPTTKKYIVHDINPFYTLLHHRFAAVPLP